MPSSRKLSDDEVKALVGELSDQETEGKAAPHFAWRDLAELTFTIQNHEENLQLASFVDDGDQVVTCSFMVHLPDTEPASFDLLYPLSTLKPLATQLRSRIQSDELDDDLKWRDGMEQAILSIPLTMTARLAESDIQPRKLLPLRPGEILAIQPGDAIEMLVEDRRFFDAALGELGGQAVLNISKRLS